MISIYKCVNKGIIIMCFFIINLAPNTIIRVSSFMDNNHVWFSIFCFTIYVSSISWNYMIYSNSRMINVII